MVQNAPASAGDAGLIDGSGRSSGEEMATHSSILAWGNPKNRRVWQATIHRVTKTQLRLSTHAQCCWESGTGKDMWS